MVSVILPAYNAEEFLEQAVMSVRAQTMPDWELILIDDGSTDSTPELCDNLADASPQIRVVHRPNMGVSEARNCGIDVARGQYLYFLDADDILHPQAFELLLAALESSEADMAVGGYLKFHSDTPDSQGIQPRYSLSDDNTSVMDADRAIEQTLYQQALDPSVWGKLYAAHLFKDVRFTPDIRYEDLDLFYLLWKEARGVVAVDLPLYFYRQHAKSYIHTFSIGRADVLTVTRRIEEWCSQSAPSLLPAARDRRFSANFNIFNLLHQHGNEYPELARECWQIIRRYRLEALLNPRVRPKNKLGALLSYLGPGITARLAKQLKPK